MGKGSSKPQIYERWYNLLGYEVHLRALPSEFNADMKAIHRAIDEERWAEVDDRIKMAYTRWGSDPDIIRAETYASFEREPLADANGFFYCKEHSYEQTDGPCPDCK